MLARGGSAPPQAPFACLDGRVWIYIYIKVRERDTVERKDFNGLLDAAGFVVITTRDCRRVDITILSPCAPRKVLDATAKNLESRDWYV